MKYLPEELVNIIISYKPYHPNAIIIKSAYNEIHKTDDEIHKLLMEYRNHYRVVNSELYQKMVATRKLLIKNCYFLKDYIDYDYNIKQPEWIMKIIRLACEYKILKYIE
jgi:hypothetical protein